MVAKCRLRLERAKIQNSNCDSSIVFKLLYNKFILPFLFFLGFFCLFVLLSTHYLWS